MPLPRDRVVFVTGASAGIGRAVAEAFLRDGARVAVCARREISGLEGALALRCDVRKPEEVRRAVAAVVEKYGALHILINNAGIGVYASVEDTSGEDLENIFRTNVFGPTAAIQAAIPHLKKTRGQVINISSILARTSIPLMAAYCMTKHALHALSVALRVEMRPFGVKVLEVGPGVTATDFQKSASLTNLDKAPVVDSAYSGWTAEKVARAILRASKRGRRELWLTFDGKLFMFLQHTFPRFADWGLERWARKFKPGAP